MGGVNGCGPQMSQAQNVQSARSLEGPPSAKAVEAKQQANMVKMQEIQGKVGKGEISNEEGQKQIQALQEENAKLQALLAPSAAGASAPAPSTGKGFSTQDSFEPAPAGKPTLMLNPTEITGSKPDLPGLGGGAKPGVSVGSN